MTFTFFFYQYIIFVTSLNNNNINNGYNLPTSIPDDITTSGLTATAIDETLFENEQKVYQCLFGPECSTIFIGSPFDSVCLLQLFCLMNGINKCLSPTTYYQRYVKKCKHFLNLPKE